MASKTADSPVMFVHNKLVSKHANPSGSSLQQLREESETEQENDLEPASKNLPFIFSFYVTSSEASVYFSISPKLNKIVQPIYLSVGNFRI